MNMFVFLAVLIASLPASDAKGFLSGRHLITTKELDNVLAQDSAGSHNIRVVEEEMRSMYLTLPKNKYGRLDSTSVRYALHRYFAHKHGWHVKGFDPAGQGWTANSSITKEWAPAYIQQSFEKRSQNGLDLKDLASFAVTVSNLIFGDGVDALEVIYEVLEYPLDQPIRPDQLELALRGYVAWITVGYGTMATEKDLLDMENNAMKMDQAYPDILLWLSDLLMSRRWHAASSRNPFRGNTITFDDAADSVKAVLHHFGSTMTSQCFSWKLNLLDHEEADNGRVLLSTFYADVDITFKESTDYLRNQGALEEGRGGLPRVVIPNYLTSPCRCVPFTDYFNVCCKNECEDLVGRVERSLLSPTGLPKQIADVVSKISSETTVAPRNLSAALVSRLDDIAQLHHGQVPIHGRLFSQWMHHAFPRECPFPHVSGSVKPSTQDEWLDLYKDIQTVLASDDERQAHITAAQRVTTSIDAIPWTHVEELVAVDANMSGKSGKSKGWRWTQLIMGLILFVSFITPLARASSNLLLVNSDKSRVMSNIGMLV